MSLFNKSIIPLLLGASLGAAGAAKAAAAGKAPARIHRFEGASRSAYDAFVYLNRLPETPQDGERASDFAGRVYGRLANQEGRILIKLPPSMNRSAYRGYKTFMGSEGDERVNNCVSCHMPAGFTDSKSHVTGRGGKAKPTPSLRNLKRSDAELAEILRAKIVASWHRQTGAAKIAAAYDSRAITEKDIPDLVAFLKTLRDVPDAKFRQLIIEAEVTDVLLDAGSEKLSFPVTSMPSGGITGVARFVGPRRKAQRVAMDEASLKLHESQPFEENALIGPDGFMANVFVQVKKGLARKEYTPPETPVMMDQIGSVFRPRVQGIMVGQKFVMRNSDPFIHNVRSMSLRNRAFNVAQPPGTADREQTFCRREGPIRMGCDFHKWMRAYLFVMEHPYFAVTDEQGRFVIKGLPPGEYELEAWHEEFGELEAEVKVGAGGKATAEFVFRPKKEE